MKKQSNINKNLALEFFESLRKENIEGAAELFDEHGAQKILEEFCICFAGSASEANLAHLVNNRCSPKNVGLLLDQLASRSIVLDLRPLGDHAAQQPRPNLEMLIALAERGLVIEPSPSAHFGGRPWSPIVRAIKYSGGKGLGALAKLCDLGALRDGEGEIGFVDFLGEGQHEASELLLSKGFMPRSQVLAHPFSPGTPALCVHLYQLQNPRWDAEDSGSILKSLDKLVAAGADFAPQAKPSKCLIGEFWADPLAVAAQLRANGAGVASTEWIFANLPSELIKRGANPNLTGHYLATELAFMGDSGKAHAEVRVEEALAFGALPSANPVAALAALANIRNVDAIQRWVTRLSQMGAPPSQLPTLGVGPRHPLPASLARRNPGYFKLLLSEGASPAWEDVFSGNTLIHMLAEKRGPMAEELLGLLLAMPAAAPLIDKPRALDPNDAKPCGATPLLAACSSLSLAQAKALLAAGANPNARDAMGRTALHCAGRKYGAKGREGCLDMIRLLMAAGADSSLLDSKGLTPAQAMAARGPIDAVAELLAFRPEDILSGSENSRRARQALESRGGHSVSLVEKAVLGVSTGESACSPMKKRRSL